MLKFIPVRGRKRSRQITVRRITVLKFIPVRGRKLPFLPLDDILADVEIYPREGTETAIRDFNRLTFNG